MGGPGTGGKRSISLFCEEQLRVASPEADIGNRHDPAHSRTGPYNEAHFESVESDGPFARNASSLDRARSRVEPARHVDRQNRQPCTRSIHERPRGKPDRKPPPNRASMTRSVRCGGPMGAMGTPAAPAFFVAVRAAAVRERSTDEHLDPDPPLAEQPGGHVTIASVVAGPASTVTLVPYRPPSRPPPEPPPARHAPSGRRLGQRFLDPAERLRPG